MSIKVATKDNMVKYTHKQTTKFQEALWSDCRENIHGDGHVVALLLLRTDGINIDQRLSDTGRHIMLE